MSLPWPEWSWPTRSSKVQLPISDFRLDRGSSGWSAMHTENGTSAHCSSIALYVLSAAATAPIESADGWSPTPEAPPHIPSTTGNQHHSRKRLIAAPGQMLRLRLVPGTCRDVPGPQPQTPL